MRTINDMRLLELLSVQWKVIVIVEFVLRGQLPVIDDSWKSVGSLVLLLKARSSAFPFL